MSNEQDQGSGSWISQTSVFKWLKGRSGGAPTGTPGGPPKAKVLVVEDDKLVSKIYGDALERGGFEVVVAMDGQKALDRLLEVMPDIVLLDLQLPRVSGLDVLRRMRAQPMFKTLPVVVFTNSFLGDIAAQAEAAGANAILQKARSTPDMVVMALRRCLGPAWLTPATPSSQPDGGDPTT